MGHDGEVRALDRALVQVRLWGTGKAMNWPLCGKHICQIPQRRRPQGEGQARASYHPQNNVFFEEIKLKKNCSDDWCGRKEDKVIGGRGIYKPTVTKCIVQCVKHIHSTVWQPP